MLDQKIENSKEIIDKAILDFNPKAVVMMISGGDDSLTAYHVSKLLGINFSMVIHGHTGTGIRETLDFVNLTMSTQREKLIISSAGSAYADYVMKKGFFGKGLKAHSYAFHLLKMSGFRKTVAKDLRKGKHNFSVLYINGARRDESLNRSKNMISPYKIDPNCSNNIWVNILHNWSKHDCIDFLDGSGIKRNPVAINLCRSGECMCGTTQSVGDRTEASFFYPVWGQWLDHLEKQVIKKFPWKWGHPISNSYLMEAKGQLPIFSEFAPMCSSCLKTNEKIKI